MEKTLAFTTCYPLTSPHKTIPTREVVMNPNGIVTKRLGFSATWTIESGDAKGPELGTLTPKLTLVLAEKSRSFIVAVSYFHNLAI